MARRIVAVVGGGEGSDAVAEQEARQLGELIARQGWILVNGGRRAGMMHASAQGAHEAGGLVVGLLPGAERSGVSDFVDVAIVTGMGSARNNIITLSADVVIACPGGAGTLSEIALAIKNGKTVILMGWSLGPEMEERLGDRLHGAPDASAAVALAQKVLKE